MNKKHKIMNAKLNFSTHPLPQNKRLDRVFSQALFNYYYHLETNLITSLIFCSVPAIKAGMHVSQAGFDIFNSSNSEF